MPKIPTNPKPNPKLCCLKRLPNKLLCGTSYYILFVLFYFYSINTCQLFECARLYNFISLILESSSYQHTRHLHCSMISSRKLRSSRLPLVSVAAAVMPTPHIPKISKAAVRTPSGRPLPRFRPNPHTRPLPRASHVSTPDLSLNCRVHHSMHCTTTFVKCHWKISAYGFNRWIDRADDFGWQGSGFF